MQGRAKRNHRESHKGRNENDHRSHVVKNLICAAGSIDLFENELDRIGDGLDAAVKAESHGTQTALDVGAYLAFHVNQHHCASKSHRANCADTQQGVNQVGEFRNGNVRPNKVANRICNRRSHRLPIDFGNNGVEGRHDGHQVCYFMPFDHRV